MTVADLPAEGLGRLLRGPGVAFASGPFNVLLSSPFAILARDFHALYAGCTLLGEDDFIDFRLAVASPSTLRRWWRPQSLFQFDGRAPFRPLAAAHAVPMLEWGLNWCVANHAHQYLIIHAAALERGGRVLLLPAPPGSGKSTLCAALMHEGWRLLSDELALVRPSDGQVVGLARPVSLKNDSIAVMRSYAPAAVFSTPAEDTQKGTVCLMAPPADAVTRVHESAPPAWVVEPRYVPGAPARLESRSRAETCVELARNAFNYSLLGVRGFDCLSAVIDACRCFRFEYGNLDEAIQVFAELAEQP